MGLQGDRALYDIDQFVTDREQAHEELSASEKNTLDIVQRDALQAAYQQQDISLFNEYQRQKLVELEYLYQVRGIRQVMPSAIFQEGYAGYGNSWTGSKIRLLYPQDRKRAGRESREPFLPINKLHETTTTGSQLVPLRINLQTDKYQLRDRLVWNVDDDTIPLELFVENLLEDYGIPFSFAGDILKSLQAQINSHLPHIYPRDKETRTGDENLRASEAPVSELNDADAEGYEDKSITTTEATNSESSSVKETTPMTASATETPAAAVPSTGVPTRAASVVESSVAGPSTTVLGRAEPTAIPVSATTMPASTTGMPTTSTTAVPTSSTTAVPTTAMPSISMPTTGMPATDAATTIPATAATGISTQPETSAAPATTSRSNSLPEGIVDPSLENKKYKYDEDMRLTIKIDITIGQHQLVDRFEWDLNNRDNDPELFALSVVSEMSLPSEFATAIAHNIREQSQIYSSALFNSGYQFDGKPPHVRELRDELAMPVDEHAFLRRPEALELYTPVLRETKTHGADGDPHELEQERRELRSRRRQGRSYRRHQQETRTSINLVNDPSIPNKDNIGPDVSTPVYSSLLPGGLDRNLSILHMVAYREDELYGGDRQDLVYHFNKNRKRAQVPSASLFDETLVQNDGPKWMVKLKIPKGFAEKLEKRL